MSDRGEQGWEDFWTHQTAGCLPQGKGSLGAIQQASWAHFARTLPPATRVLDLATGDGRVMGWMFSARSDLALEGIDLAPRLPPPPDGTVSRGGIAMERLPYGDGTFDAVVSQFGFEYGDPARVPHEIARVLRPGAVAALMLHRLDGPIVAHNRGRRSEIRWATERHDVVGAARAALDLMPPATGELPSPLAYALRESAQRFGSSSPAWEITEAARRILARSGAAPKAELAAALDRLAQSASGEIARIEALERAAKSVADSAGLATALADAGLTAVDTLLLREAQDFPPFAELRILRRAS